MLSGLRRKKLSPVRSCPICALGTSHSRALLRLAADDRPAVDVGLFYGTEYGFAREIAGELAASLKAEARADGSAAYRCALRRARLSRQCADTARLQRLYG
jgi:hypothetical protein